MPRSVVPLRASEQEKGSWDEAAALTSKKFSAWARSRLNEAAAADLAERDEREQQEAARARMLNAAVPSRSFTPDFK